jgi:branched-subunit amino acid aminotransferase/4-amino-4-deoxychorismate lyase
MKYEYDRDMTQQEPISATPIVYLNGRFLPLAEARLSPEDRGFLLGDGVFDTLRTYRGGWFRFARHADRFFAGLDEVRIAPPFTHAGLRGILDELLGMNGLDEAVARVTVTRGAGSGGYRFDPSTPPTVYASLRPVPDMARLRREGVSLGSSAIPRPLPFLHVVKSTSVGAMALARMLSEDDEVVLPDAEGRVAEGAASWILAVIDGRAVTPRSSRLLRSITRGVVEEYLEIEERDLAFDDLRAAEALMISATSFGPVPVRRFEEIAFPLDHPLFARIFAGYDERIRQECGV